MLQEIKILGETIQVKLKVLDNSLYCLSFKILPVSCLEKLWSLSITLFSTHWDHITKWTNYAWIVKFFSLFFVDNIRAHKEKILCHSFSLSLSTRYILLYFITMAIADLEIPFEVTKGRTDLEVVTLILTENMNP